jgi:KDO2-lipid IV(A) lauroyltransferase
LGAVLAEFPHLERIYNSKPGEYIELVHTAISEVFQDNADRPAAVFVTAHLANWEIAAVSIVLQGVPLAVVYTSLQNPKLDRLLRRSRKSLRCELIERDSAGRQLIRQLKQGTSVGLIVDQRVDSGEPVPFFRHNMQTTITPAQLALRFKCDLIPVQVQRLPNARFRVIFHAPITADDETASEREKMLQMTRKTNALFENWIRERPEEWLCSKRRWAKDLQP